MRKRKPQSHLQQTFGGMLDSQNKVQILLSLRRRMGNHWQVVAAMASQDEAMTCWRKCTALYPPANEPRFTPEAA
jgi:hypothetical protein